MKMITASMVDKENLVHSRIETGIKKGLDDVKAGRFFEATSANIRAMKVRIKSRG